MSFSIKTSLGAALTAGALMFSADRAQAEDYSLVVFLGGGISKDSVSNFAGAIWAPSGFDEDGVFIRAIASVGSFDFDTALAPSGSADATTYGGNLSVGYRMKFGDFVVAPFVGIDLFGRDISPGVADTGQIDDEVGVIVGARIDNSGVIQHESGNIRWSIDGSWASTNSRYYAEAEVGYDFGIVTIGPKAAALGNDDFNAYRVGGFVSFALFDDVVLKVGSGYQFGEDNNPFGGVATSSSDTFYVVTSVALVF